jgi:hypothetical protein
MVTERGPELMTVTSKVATPPGSGMVVGLAVFTTVMAGRIGVTVTRSRGSAHAEVLER